MLLLFLTFTRFHGVLHQDEVEPLVEFQPDVGEVSDLGESEAAVEFEAWELVRGDQRNNLAMPEAFGAGEQVCQENTSESLAVQIMANVDRVLDGKAVSGTGIEGAQRGPCENVVHGGVGDGDGVAWAVGVEPGGTLGISGRLVLVGRRRGINVMVVYRVDGGQVGFGGKADLKRHRNIVANCPRRCSGVYSIHENQRSTTLYAI